MSVHRDPRNGSYIVKWKRAGHSQSKSFGHKADADLFNGEVKRAKQLNDAFGRIQIATPTPKTPTKPTHVYVIAGGDKIKIGIASKPRQRLADLGLGSPVPLTLVRTVITSRAADLEAALHARYADSRSHGEWFDADPVLADLATLTDDDLAGLVVAKPNRQRAA